MNTSSKSSASIFAHKRRFLDLHTPKSHDILLVEGKTIQLNRPCRYQVSITDAQGVPSERPGDFHLCSEWDSVNWFVTWRSQGLDKPTNFIVETVK